MYKLKGFSSYFWPHTCRCLVTSLVIDLANVEVGLENILEVVRLLELTCL